MLRWQKLYCCQIWSGLRAPRASECTSAGSASLGGRCNSCTLIVAGSVVQECRKRPHSAGRGSTLCGDAAGESRGGSGGESVVERMAELQFNDRGRPCVGTTNTDCEGNDGRLRLRTTTEEDLAMEGRSDCRATCIHSPRVQRLRRRSGRAPGWRARSGAVYDCPRCLVLSRSLC